MIVKESEYKFLRIFCVFAVATKEFLKPSTTRGHFLGVNYSIEKTLPKYEMTLQIFFEAGEEKLNFKQIFSELNAK